MTSRNQRAKDVLEALTPLELGDTVTFNLDRYEVGSRAYGYVKGVIDSIHKHNYHVRHDGRVFVCSERDLRRVDA